MLIPYLSDSSINESILPFLFTINHSLRLHSNYIESTIKKYFAFIYYVTILSIILLLNCSLTIESVDLDHIWLCVGVLAKFKNKLTRTDSSSSVSTIKGETSSTVKSSDRVTTSDTIQNYDDVIDISRGSEWDVRHQTDQQEETTSMTSTDSDSSSEHSITCSTCPGISTETVDSIPNPIILVSDTASTSPTYIDYNVSQVSIPNSEQNLYTNNSSSNLSVIDNTTDTSSLVSSFESKNSMEISESDFPLNKQVARLR